MASGMKVRKCGCIAYEVGPPLQCDKHKRKEIAKEQKELRRVIGRQVQELGHELTAWSEKQNEKGKWTAYCRHCGSIVIVYDDVPAVSDQVSGWALTKECKRGQHVAPSTCHDLGPDLLEDGDGEVLEEPPVED